MEQLLRCCLDGGAYTSIVYFYCCFERRRGPQRPSFLYKIKVTMLLSFTFLIVLQLHESTNEKFAFIIHLQPTFYTNCTLVLTCYSFNLNFFFCLKMKETELLKENHNEITYERWTTYLYSFVRWKIQRDRDVNKLIFFARRFSKIKFTMIQNWIIKLV